MAITQDSLKKRLAAKKARPGGFLYAGNTLKPTVKQNGKVYSPLVRGMVQDPNGTRNIRTGQQEELGLPSMRIQGPTPQPTVDPGQVLARHNTEGLPAERGIVQPNAVAFSNVPTALPKATERQITNNRAFARNHLAGVREAAQADTEAQNTMRTNAIADAKRGFLKPDQRAALSRVQEEQGERLMDAAAERQRGLVPELQPPELVVDPATGQPVAVKGATPLPTKGGIVSSMDVPITDDEGNMIRDKNGKVQMQKVGVDEQGNIKVGDEPIDGTTESLEDIDKEEEIKKRGWFARLFGNKYYGDDQKVELDLLRRRQAARKAPGEKAQPASAQPKVGEVRQGYRFNGGDPSKSSNWVKVQ